MKKYVVVLVAVGVFVLSFAIGVFASELVWEEISRAHLNLKTVLVQSDNPRIIYIGSDKGIFKSEDGGTTWRNVLSIRGTNREVNFLLFASDDKNALYAGTGNGLYFSSNGGRNWNRIFKGKNYLENECTALANLPSAIYLGTKAGLFISSDNGRTWNKETGKIGSSHILAIAYNLKEPAYIYIASIDGVFKTADSGQSWERIFLARPVENGDDKDEVTEDQDEEERFSDIRYISVDSNNTEHLYIATRNGVYRSKDKGKTWDAMTDYGLLNRDVRFLLISPESCLYAVTKSGIFEYRNDRWQELSFGLVAEDVRFLALDKQNNLYAACDKGLFKTNVRYSNDNGEEHIMSLYYKDEPQINEVQQVAIKYAEVEVEKIREWRRRAKIKAILPKLTVGLDRSESTNYEIYTSATTKYVYEGPYDKSNGWDITLSWELGDLIWNNDQTSIDVRSRLMVQLREDVLDEVTKLYFERIRVKMELDNLSIEDRKKRFEKELKLQELTAQLDGLTGGYFSSQIK